MIKRGVLGEEFFINQNFEENESLAFQLSNALSTDEIYEIPFSRNSFENARKWQNLPNSSSQITHQIWSKKSIFRIFWNEFSKTYKMLQAMKQDAQAASFLILIFSRESQNFLKNHIFHPEISVYWPQKCQNYWETFSFEHNEFFGGSSYKIKIYQIVK